MADYFTKSFVRKHLESLEGVLAVKSWYNKREDEITYELYVNSHEREFENKIKQHFELYTYTLEKREKDDGQKYYNLKFSGLL